MNLTAEEKITKCKTWIILRKPFFASIMLKLKFKKVDWHPTAATDGNYLIWNENFVNSLPIETVRSLIAHEVMHVASAHHLRMKKRNKNKWNVAGDFVINNILKQEGFEIPEDWLYDIQYHNMSTEHVYDLIPDPDPNECKGLIEVLPVGSLAKDGESIEKPDLSDSQIEAIEQELKITLKQAIQNAKTQGNLSNYLDRFTNDIVESKVPWKEILRNFVTQPTKGDYSFMRGNRRHLYTGLYLPSNYQESLGDVVLAADTSASIGTKELTQFQSELNNILEDTHPSKITVLYVDTTVAHIEEFSYDDLPIKINAKGGGGTSFDPPFQWLEKQKITPAVFIYLTDLEGSCHVPEPPYPVLWVTTGNQTNKDVSFGSVTHLEIN